MLVCMLHVLRVIALLLIHGATMEKSDKGNEEEEEEGEDRNRGRIKTVWKGSFALYNSVES